MLAGRPSAHTTARPPARLSALSLVWRTLVTFACLAVLLVGGLTRSNDLFPFGVLDQFSRGIPPNGQVVNTCLQGVTAEGAVIDIRFGHRSVGIERADVENQLPAIQEDPALLEPLAAEYDRRHPDDAPLQALILCQRITQLRDGAAHGEEELVEVTQWER
ncbi:hypothetical protein [Brachybacterium sp. Marseille-Q7125]|uniref:hypothetical protein n=1 Tax=Brachybacterium sp. Marseille-Q7125 TaxID=2932815 RepID=UPI001FF21304|nr:hypothetical protein [Brachybacterium sp. Marseille-Q7125]